MMPWLLALWLACSGPVADPDARWRGEIDDCGPGLPADATDQAIALGRAFLLANQRPEGRFHYEYDWRAKTDSTDDNEVRQAGATWGLALLLHDRPDDDAVREALDKALGFWAAHATERDGQRLLVYPGQRQGSTGGTALVALAHIEALRSGAFPPEREATLRAHLQGLLRTLVVQRAAGGGFHSAYTVAGRPLGPPNPYADGEALLALVKAARHLDRTDLLAPAVAWAHDDHARNVVQALAADPDSDTTKGYYQWASMAWYELHGAGADGPWADWLLDLAVWMIDTHQTLRRRRNTSYAYEGIVPAFAVATERGDPRAAKYRCVIDQGLRKLTTWQVGHPLALPYVQEADPTDARARGGVQNIGDEPGLRVDVTQHQVHALILHRRLVLGR